MVNCVYFVTVAHAIYLLENCGKFHTITAILYILEKFETTKIRVRNLPASARSKHSDFCVIENRSLIYNSEHEFLINYLANIFRKPNNVLLNS